MNSYEEFLHISIVFATLWKHTFVSVFGIPLIDN